MDKINEMLDKMVDFMKSEAKTETVIGQQFKLGEFTCVPVMSIGLALAGGGGEGKGSMKSTNEAEGMGTAGGGGLGMAPVGFLVAKGNEIEFISTRTSKGLGAAFEKIPDLLVKFLDKNKKEKEPVTV